MIKEPPHYVAQGFSAGSSASGRSFVMVAPNFPLGVDGVPVHVSVAYYMTPADARDLSERLLVAADAAESDEAKKGEADDE
jgi:hypothetical protein